MKKIKKTWRWDSDPRTKEEAGVRVTRRGVAADVARAARARPTFLVPRREVRIEVLELLKEDRQRLLNVADVVRSHGASAAVGMARRFDTAVRDRLPRSFFLLLQDEGGEW